MATVTSAKQAAKSSTIKNQVFEKCVQCNQMFVAKYWDDELDWYIELNGSSACTPCRLALSGRLDHDV